MSVAFRQPTFQNPLGKILNIIGKGLFAVFVGIIAFGESAGRARAASELARMGLYDEARNLMLPERKEQ